MKAFKIIILYLVFLIHLTKLDAQGVSDYLMKAGALIASGDPDGAISFLNKAVASEKNCRVLLLRADAFILKGDLSGAINDLNECNRLDSVSGEYGLARVYSLKGDVQTSLYHLERNLGSDQKRSEKEIMLDPSFIRIQNTSEWRAFWRKERYSESERKVSEIEFYSSSGRIEEVQTLMNEIRSGYPGSEEDLYAESMYFVVMKKYADAVKKLVMLCEKHPENIKYLKLLVRAQEESSNAAGAVSTYTRILESGTSDARVLLARAGSFRKTGENEKALADIEKFLSIYPDDREALSQAGKLYAVNGDNLKALEIFTRNLSLHPSDPGLYIDRANSYLASRSWQWAINDYSMSLDLDPGNSDAWLNKGVALMNSGKQSEACHDFRKALDLGSKRASDLISRNCIK